MPPDSNIKFNAMFFADVFAHRISWE
jgi:hypothetical protein